MGSGVGAHRLQRLVGIDSALYMEDLADTATDWWSEMLKQVQCWHDDHMALTPLARLTHDCQAPTSLSLKKWTRLERRASARLMSAIPEPIKGEVLSSRTVTTFGILCKLYVAYQPGGLAEKSLVLAALENPQEETSLGKFSFGSEEMDPVEVTSQGHRREHPRPNSFIVLLGLR